MSRRIDEQRYLCVENLWLQIDQWSNEIDCRSQDAVAKSSESYKMLLMGRREMLEILMDYLSENQQDLKEIADRFGLNVKGEETYDE